MFFIEAINVQYILYNSQLMRLLIKTCFWISFNIWKKYKNLRSVL